MLTVLSAVVRVGLIELLRIKQRFEGGKGVRLVDI